LGFISLAGQHAPFVLRRLVPYCMLNHLALRVAWLGGGRVKRL
jgi:hypothetical protein